MRDGHLHGVASGRPSNVRWASAGRPIPDYGNGAIFNGTESREIRAVQHAKVQRAGAVGFVGLLTAQERILRGDSSGYPFISPPSICDSCSFLHFSWSKARGLNLFCDSGRIESGDEGAALINDHSAPPQAGGRLRHRHLAGQNLQNL